MKRTPLLSVCCHTAVSLMCSTLLLLGGCSGGGGALPASPVVSESFKTDANKNVAIQSDALNREFLLQGNLIQLNSAQEFSGLKSRVVVFQKQGGKLFMLESQVGHTVTPDTPFALILAEFPIVAEESGWIWFDFNQGMSSIFTTAEIFTSDYDGSGYTPSFAIAPVRSSFLTEVDVSRLNRLVVRQSAQIADANKTLPSVEVRYYLSPYLPDASFKPTASPGFDHAGYFEVMPQLKSGGGTKVLAMKWNLNKKPITYYISSNTPPEYRQAITNGVLYWNVALGEEVFAVADAPVGVTAPDMDRNIIQWLNYDTADYAYADMQSDPRTGEILHSQIFIPSAFAVAGRASAWQLLKILGGTPATSAKNRVSLRNMYAPRLCDFPAKEQLTENIATLLANKAPDDVILKVSQAYVQEVLTHEVGHTMGLRHNFAGSLAADYAGHSREELYTNFANGGAYITMRPSSSVMDYNAIFESVLFANLYNTEHVALSHDSSAMRFLYQDKALDKTIPFCTDSDTDTLDCIRFDYGNSPLAFASTNMKWLLNADQSPVRFYLLQVAAVLNGTAVANLHPSPSQQASSLLVNKHLMLSPFTQGGFYARTLKNYYPGTLLQDADQTELRKAVMPLVRDDLAAWLLKNPYGMKSLTDMFMIVDPAWKDAWIARFNQITEDPAFYSITDAEGKTVTFTPTERGQLRNMANTFFTDLIPALVAEDIKLLSAVTSKIDIVDGTAGDGLLAAMNATSNGYLMARTGTTLDTTINSVALSLPLFSYDWPARLDALRLLSSRSVSSALWWGMRETDANISSLVSLLDSSVLAAGDTFQSQAIASGFAAGRNSAYQWYLENANLIE
jgi:hypothetical protein